MKNLWFWLALALANIFNVVSVRAELTSFTVGPDSPNYGNLLKFAQAIHPDDFGLAPRQGSATAVRYELKFKPKRGESVEQFVERLDALKVAVAKKFSANGDVSTRDEIELQEGETAANVTDIFPKLKLVVHVDPSTGYLMTVDRLESALARPDLYPTAELGVLPRARVYGVETSAGITITDPGHVWVDLKGKRFTDPRIVDKPRAGFSIGDLRSMRYDKIDQVRRRADEIAETSKAIGGSRSDEAPEVVHGFLLIREEFERQFGKPYAPEEGYLTQRTAWVVRKTLIQGTQDRLYRRTTPLLEPLLRAGDLSPTFRPVVLEAFESKIFPEFKFSPRKDLVESRSMRSLLRQFRFDMNLKSASQGKRFYSKKQRGK